MRIVKRKKMLVFLAFTLFLSGCEGQGNGEGDAAETRFFGMDTDISITAYGRNAEEALTDAQYKVAELEKLWSVTDENSDIYAINHSRGRPVKVSEETERILCFALDMAKQTEGALEPTIFPALTAWGFTTGENQIPDKSGLEEILRNVGYENVHLSGNEVILPGGMELDLGAVGKGFAADEVSNVLKQAGVTSALLDLGGNIQLIGSKPDGTDWKIGLRDPFGESYIGVLSISDRAVVTSGNYERYFIGEDGKQYGHILDPATGYPAENGLASVTVVAEEGKLCDALSTSLFVMGQEKAADYWRNNQNFDMILLTEKGEIYLTEGLADKFELEPDYGDMKVEQIKETADRRRMKMKKRIGSILLAVCMIISILGSGSIPVSAAAEIRLSKTAVTLQAGEKQRLSLKNMPKNGKVTWTSTSRSKASVSQKGIVTAKKPGKATIKAKLAYQSGGKNWTRNFSCRVTVKKTQSSGKTLVVYFSTPVRKRNGEVDGISSASRTAEGSTYKGNTEYIAELIRKETKADLFEIVPQQAYSNIYETVRDLAEQEQEQDARPAIKNKIKNISQYDTIYVGYPIWWADMPQILYTFFDTYDLSGKNIIPFCTHAGSGLSGTVGRIKNLEPQAIVYKGLEVYRTDVTGSDSRVKSWIQKKAK